MNTRNLTIAAAAAIVLAVSAGPVCAALNWDGQSGVFLNALAYPVAPSKFEVSTHVADLDNLGSVATYSVAAGFKGGVELGYTRYGSSVNGVSDQNLLSVKWQFVKEDKKTPAIAVWAIYRNLIGGSNTTDIGLSATKLFTPGGRPLVIDIGLRSTKALGLGLFGIGNDRKVKLEGSIALFLTNKFAIGAEFKEQIGARAWQDIAFRYIASDKLNIDAGIANFGPTLDNQIAFGATYVF